MDTIANTIFESREQRAESREQRAESREQRAESREQRAESREQRAGNNCALIFVFKNLLIEKPMKILGI